jgi:hypothetical protein
MDKEKKERKKGLGCSIKIEEIFSSRNKISVLDKQS